MPNVKLKNRQGNEVIYSNVAKVTLKDENGNDVEFAQGGGDANIIENLIAGTGSAFSAAGSYSSVRDYAFRYISNLQQVNLPNCTTVGAYAFFSCINLNSVNLPLCSVIGTGAFSNCNNMASIYLPELTSMGTFAFASCSSLTRITLPNVTNVATQAFGYCTNISEINLPNCTQLGASAFLMCSQLAVLSLNSQVGKNIPADCFHGCQQLTTFVIEDFTSAGTRAFAYNGFSYLDDASISTCSFFGDFLFMNCSSLSEIYFSTRSNIFSNRMFQGCTGLKKVTIKNFGSVSNVSSINLLLNCDNIELLSIQGITSSNSATPLSFLSGLIRNKPKLQTLNLDLASGFSYTYFPVVSKYSNLKSVIIGSGFSMLQNNNFQSCTALEYVDARYIKTGYNNIFSDCINLRSVNLDSLVGSCHDAFANCQNLESVELPNYISGGIFFSASYIKTVSVPKMISAYFTGCVALQEINMPACKSIYQMGFRNCHSLSRVYLPNLCLISGGQNFENCSALKELHLESTSEFVTIVNNPWFPSRSDFTIYLPASRSAEYLANGSWRSYSSQISFI